MKDIVEFFHFGQRFVGGGFCFLVAAFLIGYADISNGERSMLFALIALNIHALSLFPQSKPPRVLDELMEFLVVAVGMTAAWHLVLHQGEGIGRVLGMLLIASAAVVLMRALVARVKEILERERMPKIAPGEYCEGDHEGSNGHPIDYLHA